MSETLEPGLYEKVPAATYHRMPGVSQSQLKVLRELSPAHLRWQMDHPPEPSPAMVLGAAIHDAILLPDDFETVWRPLAAGDGRTKTVRGLRAAEAAAAPYAVFLTTQDYATCLAVRDAVAANKKARQLLNGEAERSAVWNDPRTGILCRGRFDLLGERTGTIVDLKTSRCAAKDKFSRDIWSYGYHMQAAFYLQGARALGLEYDRFAFVVVEKDPPYGVALYEMSHGAIKDGEREIEPLMDLYRQCIEGDVWPGYSEHVQMIDLPAWAPHQLDQKLGGSNGG